MLGGTICGLSEMSSRSRIQRWRRLAGTTLRLWSLRLSLVTRCKYICIYERLYYRFRNIYVDVMSEKSVFKKFGKFTKKHLFQSLFFLIKLQAEAGTCIKKRLITEHFRTNDSTACSEIFRR